MAQATADSDFFDRDIDDFGGDDASEDAPFSWRLDGSESMSDWTIVVTRTGNCHDEEKDEPASFDTYHVHKAILAVGPRKSEYFVTLFETQHALAELSTSTTSVELEGTAADAFPAMLDYIYDGKEEIRAQTAVALRHLARYFRIRRLFDAATRFIRENMDFDNAGCNFLPEAYKYRDEKIVEASIRVCARDIEAEEGDEVLCEYSPCLLKRIITSEHLECKSQYLSDVVASFYNMDHRKRNDEELLELLDVVTDEKIMPEVSATFSAFVLLEWDMHCQKLMPERSHSLRNRCIDAISIEWRNALGIPLDAEAKGDERRWISIKDGSSTFSRIAEVKHRKLDTSVQMEVFEKALRRAHLDMEKKDKAIKHLRRQLKKAGNTS